MSTIPTLEDLENEASELFVELYENPNISDKILNNLKAQEVLIKDDYKLLDNLEKQLIIDKSLTVPTEIKHKGKIFALSDIHGDLHAFIIALRDCAGVIRKKLQHDYNKNIVDKIDPNIEANLIIDIELADGRFDETFGYEWCGGNSYVVICGDIIDPHRTDICFRNHNVMCTNYPQIEIKLLRFINIMNKQAKLANGRIFKLLGNHEYGNIYSNDNDHLINYRFDSKEHSYRKISRKNLFNFGNPGYNLLFEDNCYTLLKINDTIFIHGELPEITTLEEIKLINNLINKTNYFRYNLPINFDWLENRNWANTNMITTRINDGTVDYFCTNNVKARLRQFMQEENVDKLRVVLGHCIQASYINTATLNINHNEVRDDQNWNIAPKIKHNTTFNNLFDSNKIVDKYNGLTIYDNSPAINFEKYKNIFGITMQCKKTNPTFLADSTSSTATLKPSNIFGLIKNMFSVKSEKPLSVPQDFFIYHIDIGSSRAFDKDYGLIDKKELENKHIYSRTPQLLLIDNSDGEDKISIIKSRVKNTRIHLPRPVYEYNVNKLSTEYKKIYPGYEHELSLDNARYLKKYLKYKHKYLLLKLLK